MTFRGGHNISLAGRPSGQVALLPEPDVLHLPLKSQRFRFSEIRVEEGRRVHPGDVLARDPDRHCVPLLAPRAGTVRLRPAPGHITLEDVAKEPEEPYHPDEDRPHIPSGMGSIGIKRYKLLVLGAWQFLYNAHTGDLPDPMGIPSAVIVSTLHLEPFTARGDVEIYKRLSNFTRGLEHLQSLLEYQNIYLVLPDIQSDFARKVRDTLRGYAWVQMVQVPMRYPFDNYAVLARRLGLKRQKDAPVWALDVAGVLAIDRALTLSRPSTVRIVSIGGPGVNSPLHVKAMTGYPLAEMLGNRASPLPYRLISGGILTGERVDPETQLGLDTECSGLTVLPEHTEREFLGFVRPGFDRRSYSKCFASLLRPAFPERLTTALRGERRPCVGCGFCEEVCPAGIMPHLIHKCLYREALEEAERARVDLCVNCGLCSYVCPSKIELRQQFVNAKETIQRELHAVETGK